VIKEKLAKEVDELFKQWDKADSPGCALAIIKDGKIIYKKGYGMANLEYDIPITPQTIFHVASVSKQFTAFSILLLEQEGKLSLKDEIQSYLSYLPHFGKKITIQHLLNHTSGLRDQWALLRIAGWRMDDVITQSDILNIVKRQKELNFKPGSEFLYSNTGYTLLAEIVAAISGMKFTDFTNLKIFKPLEMEQTHFHLDHQQIVKNRAYSYGFNSKGKIAKNILSYANVGATSLFTTVEDMAKWDKNFYTGKVGGMDVLKKMVQKGVLNDGKEIEYANGLIINKYKGLLTIGHDGGDAGFRTDFFRFPNQQITIICFSNFAGLRAVIISKKVADIILEKKLGKTPKEKIFHNRFLPTVILPIKNQKKKVSHEKLLEFTGKYFSNELLRLCEFDIKKDKLIFISPRGISSKLRYFDNDVFRNFHQIIKFKRDEQNDVKSFRISEARVKNLKFERML